MTICNRLVFGVPVMGAKSHATKTRGHKPFQKLSEFKLFPPCLRDFVARTEFAYGLLAACVAAIALTGCTTSPRFATRSTPSSPGADARGETTNSTESKTPRNPSGKILLTLEGVASYYSDEFHGKQTSNGEIYDMNGLTAAHRSFPFGTKVRITNLENAKSVVVRVNDRGPFHEGRIIDLSLGAAKELDLVRTGTARVRIEVLEWGDGT